MKHSILWRHLVSFLACGSALLTFAQTPNNPSAPEGERPPARDGAPDFGGPPGFPPGDFGPGRGRGGFGGVQEKQKLVEQFDKNGDHMLDAAERKTALEFLRKERAAGRGRRGPGGRGPFGGRGEDQEPAEPGPKISPADVKSYQAEPFYDPQVLRTFFLEFSDANWEKEMAEFKNTDVEMPAKLMVDGKTYRDVGVHFRGMSSFMMVGEGRKRSLNLSLDFIHKGQEIGGYRSMELLNSHEDPTFLRSVLSFQIERDYVAAPKANFVRVVINGESWGVYVNSQPFNKDFVRDWFGTIKGARWKVPGSPGGQGSLKYLGDDVAAYKRIYQIKSKDDPKAWADLIKLCKVLLSKLLAVPELRKRYLGYVRDVAEKWLDWKKLGPIAEQYRVLIAEDVKTDTRKLYSVEGFETGLTQDIPGRGGFGGGNVIGLKNFADQRRAYLLNYRETKKAGL